MWLQLGPSDVVHTGAWVRSVWPSDIYSFLPKFFPVYSVLNVAVSKNFSNQKSFFLYLQFKCRKLHPSLVPGHQKALRCPLYTNLNQVLVSEFDQPADLLFSSKAIQGWFGASTYSWTSSLHFDSQSSGFRAKKTGTTNVAPTLCSSRTKNCLCQGLGAGLWWPRRNLNCLWSPSLKTQASVAWSDLSKGELTEDFTMDTKLKQTWWEDQSCSVANLGLQGQEQHLLRVNVDSHTCFWQCLQLEAVFSDWMMWLYGGSL